jgi:hypothetical protein
MAKIKFVKKIICQKDNLSKFTLRKGPQSAAHSDDRFKSYGQNTAFFLAILAQSATPLPA